MYSARGGFRDSAIRWNRGVCRLEIGSRLKINLGGHSLREVTVSRRLGS